MFSILSVSLIHSVGYGAAWMMTLTYFIYLLILWDEMGWGKLTIIWTVSNIITLAFDFMAKQVKTLALPMGYCLV